MKSKQQKQEVEVDADRTPGRWNFVDLPTLCRYLCLVPNYQEGGWIFLSKDLFYVAQNKHYRFTGPRFGYFNFSL